MSEANLSLSQKSYALYELYRTCLPLPEEYVTSQQADVLLSPWYQLEAKQPSLAITVDESVELPGDVDPEGLTQELDFLLPPMVKRHIGRIALRPIDYTKEGFPSIIDGFYTYTADGGYIAIDSNMFMRPSGEVLDYANTPSKNMRATLFHEAGHALHHIMPDDLLEEWESIRNKNKPFSNVRKRTDHGNVAMEDFANTHEMFLAAPYDLTIYSQERYDFMDFAYSELHPAYDAVAEIQQGKIERQANAVSADLEGYAMSVRLRAREEPTSAAEPLFMRG